MRAYLVLAAVVSLSTGAIAQQTALLGPVEISPVVDQCQIVANNQKSGDRSTDGLCVGKTQSFLTELIANSPTDAVLDQTIADLVVQLANLAAGDAECNAFDTEIAAAIRLASSFAADPDQRVQLVEISQTVEACEDTTTAALPNDGVPASGN